MQRRMNSEAILAKLAEIRRAIPRLSTTPRPERKSLVAARTIEEFEAEAVADALEALAEDIQTTVREAEDRLYEQALDAYHVAEELARDPAHADLIPHVEALRKAHQNSYGRPVPKKEETEARRRNAGRDSRAEAG